MHLIGHIEVRIYRGNREWLLEVEDDGFGYAWYPGRDGGLEAARRLAEAWGGQLEHDQSWAINVARLRLPA